MTEKTVKELHVLKGEKHVVAAEKIGISRVSYTLILSGKQRPSLSVARRIAQYFGYPLDSIKFGGDVDKINNNVEKQNQEEFSDQGHSSDNAS